MLRGRKGIQGDLIGSDKHTHAGGLSEGMKLELGGEGAICVESWRKKHPRQGKHVN